MTSPPDPRHHGNRHGRSEAARSAVLQAVDDLLVERGLAGVTIEAIAARAQVAKQTIYRWWTSKTDILFEALVLDAEAHFTLPDHGDLARDLRDHLRQLAVFLTGTDAGAVWRALAGQAQLDPAVADRFSAEVTAPQRERDRRLHDRARERGQLPPGAAHFTKAASSLRTLRGLVNAGLRRYRAAKGDPALLTSIDVQTALTLLKVEASELAVATVMSALRACGLSGYRNDGDASIGRHLRDVLSSPLMINNDRILASLASPARMSAVPTGLAD